MAPASWQQVAVSVSWIAFSGASILINKYIMVDLQFPFPATVAWMGQVLTLCCSTAYARLILPPAQRKPMSLKKYVPTVMFTSFCTAIALHTGNLAYLYLSVAFIQMLKICSPVLAVLLGFLAKIKEATPRLVGALLVTGGGVVLATYGQLPLSLPGLACMMASGLAEGVHGVLAVSLQMVSDEQVRHPLEILMYVSSGCTLWLTVQVVFWELWPLLSARAYLIPLRHPVHFFAAATFSMAVEMLHRPFFERCSSLTCWVLATVKDASLVAIGVLVLHEHVSQLQLLGYAISLAGYAFLILLLHDILSHTPVATIATMTSCLRLHCWTKRIRCLLCEGHLHCCRRRSNIVVGVGQTLLSALDRSERVEIVAHDG